MTLRVGDKVIVKKDITYERSINPIKKGVKGVVRGIAGSYISINYTLSENREIKWVIPKNLIDSHLSLSNKGIDETIDSIFRDVYNQ